MIRPDRLYDFLQQQGVGFYTGVPDSLLKDFLQYLQDAAGEEAHVITANEGLAIGLASGYHFATGKLPLVYLQNSGLGNIINPLTSLADKEMYAVPMLLMIGWRGKPGVKDEPQHLKMGRITVALLEALELPYFILDEQEVTCFEKIAAAVAIAQKEQRPVVLLIPGEIMSAGEQTIEPGSCYSLERENTIKEIIAALTGEEMVICTTGKIGREFYEQNNKAGKKIKKYLLSVGAMGHAGHIALGINRHTEKKLVMLDGDGALLMQLGALPSIAHYAKNNFIHIVLNNGTHESVGGQPTEAFNADLCGIAEASGYPATVCITDQDQLQQWLIKDLPLNNTQFVEIRISSNSRADLGRPAGTPIEWKTAFMQALHKNK